MVRGLWTVDLKMKNMAEKSPAFQWYPKDILGSARVAQLSLMEEGAYRRALDYCWLQGHLPADVKALAKVIGKGCTPKIAGVVKPMFKERDHEKTLPRKTF